MSNRSPEVVNVLQILNITQISSRPDSTKTSSWFPSMMQKQKRWNHEIEVVLNIPAQGTCDRLNSVS